MPNKPQLCALIAVAAFAGTAQAQDPAEVQRQYREQAREQRERQAEEAERRKREADAELALRLAERDRERYGPGHSSTSTQTASNPGAASYSATLTALGLGAVALAAAADAYKTEFNERQRQRAAFARRWHVEQSCDLAANRQESEARDRSAELADKVRNEARGFCACFTERVFKGGFTEEEVRWIIRSEVATAWAAIPAPRVQQVAEACRKRPGSTGLANIDRLLEIRRAY